MRIELEGSGSAALRPQAGSDDELPGEPGGLHVDGPLTSTQKASRDALVAGRRRSAQIDNMAVRGRQIEPVRANRVSVNLRRSDRPRHVVMAGLGDTKVRTFPTAHYDLLGRGQ